jgi:hypothetical protein
MKLRIKGNSIRLRLGRSEVSEFLAVGVVEESTTFDPAGLQRLKYRLVATDDLSEVSANFEDGCLTVSLPTDLANSWGSTDRIGIEASQRIAEGSTLRILIEKDLECLDAPPEESQADAFPRSSHGSACSSTQA